MDCYMSAHCPEKSRGTSKRLTRSTLIHDDTFMKSLPKSRHYMVVALQRQLTRLGFLQNHREREVFRVWLEQHRSMCHLEKQLQDLKLSGTSRPDVTLEDLLKHSGRRTLPNVHISPEDTAAHREHISASLEGNGGGASSCQLNGKQTRGQDDTELMFPEVFTREFKVPKFSALQSTFLEGLSTSTPLVRSDELSSRSRNIEITRHKLRLMHNLTHVHKAETQRIMTKKSFSLQCIDGFSIKELMEKMEYECPHYIQIEKSRCPAETDLTPLSLNDESKCERPESLTENPDTQISSQFIKDSCSTEAALSSDSDIPLCIHDLYTSHAVQGERSEEKMWRNYTEI